MARLCSVVFDVPFPASCTLVRLFRSPSLLPLHRHSFQSLSDLSPAFSCVCLNPPWHLEENTHQIFLLPFRLFFFFFLKPPLITNFSPLDGGVPFPSLLCWWDLISFVRILYPRIQLALLITLLGCLRHNSKSVHLKHFHHLTKAWPSSSVTCPCELCTFFSDGKSVHLS